MKKSVMLVAGILAVALAGSAQAATMFAVQDSTGTVDKFAVDNNGSVSAGLFTYDAVNMKLGSGLSTGHAPESSMHLVDLTTSAARGMIVGQHNDGNQAANVLMRKSRGTDLAPTALLQGDYVAALHGNMWDGSKYVTTATLNTIVDGPVTTSSAPQAILFSTGVNSLGVADPGNKIERIRVTSSGDVIVANKGKYSTAAVMASNATTGFMYIPTVAGALTTCGTIGSQHAGHAPLWVDTTTNQICTCIGATLKCI